VHSEIDSNLAKGRIGLLVEVADIGHHLRREDNAPCFNRICDAQNTRHGFQRGFLANSCARSLLRADFLPAIPRMSKAGFGCRLSARCDARPFRHGEAPVLIVGNGP